jgi:cytochrome c-type biogenesis protein CcmH/NrfF
MAAKRKYARIGENSTKHECTNKKCKWQGLNKEKSAKKVSECMEELVCPKCGNSSFYGLI